jgi:hypothetical protein
MIPCQFAAPQMAFLPGVAGDPDPNGPFSGPIWQEGGPQVPVGNFAFLLGLPSYSPFIINNWTDDNGSVVGEKPNEQLCGVFSVCVYWNPTLKEWDSQAAYGSGGLITLAEAWHKATFPIDVAVVNADLFVGGVFATGIGGAAIALGCGEPTPAEPATCAAAVAGGLPTALGGIGLVGYSEWYFTNVTLPILRHWGNE